MDHDGRWHQSAFQWLQGRPTSAKRMTPTAASIKGKYRFDPHDDDCWINHVSVKSKEFKCQHGPNPSHADIWHDKRVPVAARSQLIFLQPELLWMRPKLAEVEKWTRKQLD